MSGVIIEPFTSIEAAERNFARLNEAVVALQGGSIAIENIEGYENLVTKLDLEVAIKTVQYAIGDIHITESSQDPAEKFGYGKWEIVARGRALAGIDVPPDGEVGYEPDQDFQQPAQEGGEKTHQLTVEELPQFQAELESPWKGDGRGPYYKNADGAISKTGFNDGKKILTKPVGGDKAHSILQPYYCVYFWKRIE